MDPREHKWSRRTVLLGAAQAAVTGVVLSRGQPILAEEPDLGSAGKKEGYVIWDVHGHLSSPGDTPVERITNVLKFVDRMGIERIVVFMGYPWSEDPTPEELRKQNDQVMQAVAHAGGRAFGFVYLNPRHTQASLDELNRCVRDGPLVGVKLWVAVRCREECLDPLIARAAELKGADLAAHLVQDHGQPAGRVDGR